MPHPRVPQNQNVNSKMVVVVLGPSLTQGIFSYFQVVSEPVGAIGPPWAGRLALLGEVNGRS